ncbi:MAG: isoamylase early set domain-containing protein [Desulfococcaceae bacterium]
MPVKKQFLKSRPICKVTFRLPKEEAEGADSAFLVGDFNDWEEQSTPMKTLKSGDFTVTVDLETGREYHYRFKLPGDRWKSDPEAESYAPSPFPGVENSVVDCRI